MTVCTCSQSAPQATPKRLWLVAYANGTSIASSEQEAYEKAARQAAAQRTQVLVYAQHGLVEPKPTMETVNIRKLGGSVES